MKEATKKMLEVMKIKSPAVLQSRLNHLRQKAQVKKVG
jgi:hypothetical protein